MRIQHTTYRKIIAVLILLSCVNSLFAQDSKTYHVTADATDGGNGLSWNQAITLTEALRQAKAGDEIWFHVERSHVHVFDREGKRISD